MDHGSKEILEVYAICLIPSLNLHTYSPEYKAAGIQMPRQGKAGKTDGYPPITDTWEPGEVLVLISQPVQMGTDCCQFKAAISERCLGTNELLSLPGSGCTRRADMVRTANGGGEQGQSLQKVLVQDGGLGAGAAGKGG